MVPEWLWLIMSCVKAEPSSSLGSRWSQTHPSVLLVVRPYLRQRAAGLSAVSSACFTKPGVFRDLVRGSLPPPTFLSLLARAASEVDHAAEADGETHTNTHTPVREPDTTVEDTFIDCGQR